MNYYNLVKIDNVLLQVIRDFSPSYFVTDGSNQMNQKLIGLWVEYLGGDRVVKQNDRILICRTIEDAIIEQ
tara:strand:- start:4107 stop:4319 length:213 start_codon:yes stop_codon:yes gene_type:complete